MRAAQFPQLVEISKASSLSRKLVGIAASAPVIWALVSLSTFSMRGCNQTCRAMIGDVLASRLDDVLRCELQAVSKMLEANCKKFGHFVTLLMKMVEWGKTGWRRRIAIFIPSALGGPDLRSVAAPVAPVLDITRRVRNAAMMPRNITA